MKNKKFYQAPALVENKIVFDVLLASTFGDVNIGDGEIKDLEEIL